MRPAAHVCLCGETPLIARSGEDLAPRQRQGGNKLMKEADSKASARRTGSDARLDGWERWPESATPNTETESRHVDQTGRT